MLQKVVDSSTDNETHCGVSVVLCQVDLMNTLAVKQRLSGRQRPTSLQQKWLLRDTLPLFSQAQVLYLIGHLCYLILQPLRADRAEKQQMNACCDEKEESVTNHVTFHTGRPFLTVGVIPSSHTVDNILSGICGTCSGVSRHPLPLLPLSPVLTQIYQPAPHRPPPQAV